MAAGRKTGGRRKGTPNKTTKQLKDAILQAAEDVGEDGAGAAGLVGYLRRLAVENTSAFGTLLGKVLPYQVTGVGDGPVQIEVVTGIDRAPDDPPAN